MHFPLLSHKAARFTESVIRGMSIEAAKYQAVNLAQGLPDFPAPAELKAAACRAIEADINQYAITWGARNLRHAVAEHAEWHLGLAVDPETEITVTCGSTEAMLVALLSMINPGDEVVLSHPSPDEPPGPRRRPPPAPFPKLPGPPASRPPPPADSPPPAPPAGPSPRRS